ncbi:hypothetical protein CROQUDRAFT_45856 [Cronartium quercuum f. sp. fusiforme G11]|uniref:NADH:flavin oxidoreductase/NADH oxidase N-terminal domain-containing protein n=1 Tax=Cronartium quercuum f. sp. fusiforme G11 TaxID=708437 RepID=A0A9P6NJM0_9BASI|nr:hypothetical protein CROQUDRAFT_45856 [Cronartium quercuum f. sp. fusiforme G11]
MNEIETLATKQTLPCGLTLPNRLVKAAMEPCLAEKGEPTEKHFKLHSEWSRGGFGLIITENVQVDQRYLGTPHDIIIPKNHHTQEQIPKSWKTWSNSSSNIPTLIQLCHTGLQSCRSLGRKFWEPSISPISMRLSLGNSLLDKLFSILLFNYSKMMNKEDIKLVINQFRDGALLAYRSGFQGVQLHCSHGYLLAQFMSPRTNQRTDEYGNSPYNRLRILFEIIDSIRESVPTDFCLAIKLNSADFVDGGLSEDDALKNVEWIVEHGGVDLIEISGGTYENCGK